MLQAARHLQHFAGVDFLQRYLAYEPFHIARLFQQFQDVVVQVLLRYQVFHHIEPLLYFADIEQWEHQPALHHAGTHGSNRVVDGLQQVAARLVRT